MTESHESAGIIMIAKDLTAAPFLCARMATIYTESASSPLDYRSWWIKDYGILENSESVPIRVVKRKKNKFCTVRQPRILRDLLVLRFRLSTISSLVVPLLIHAMMLCLSG